MRVCAVQTERKTLLVGNLQTVLPNLPQKSKLCLPARIRVAAVSVLAIFGGGRELVVGFPQGLVI